jgi:hypothetical protein
VPPFFAGLAAGVAAAFSVGTVGEESLFSADSLLGDGVDESLAVFASGVVSAAVEGELFFGVAVASLAGVLFFFRLGVASALSFDADFFRFVSAPTDGAMTARPIQSASRSAITL